MYPTHYPPTGAARGWRRGAAALTTAIAAAAMAVAVAPTAAHADDFRCSNPPFLGDFHIKVRDSARDEDFLLVFENVRAQKTFLVRGGINLLNDSSVTQTFSREITETTTTTVEIAGKATASTMVELAKNRSVASSIEFSSRFMETKVFMRRETDVRTLPRHTAQRANRGVEGLNLRFNLRHYLLSEGKCKPRPQFDLNDVFREIPTEREEFQYLDHPTIPPSGITNDRDRSTVFHPGDAVTLESANSNFDAPSKVIMVRQTGRKFKLGPGSPGFTETASEIKLIIPAEVPPGSNLTVTVRKRAGQPGELDTPPEMTRTIFVS